MNCPECKDRLSPDNPEVGRYLLRTGQYFVPLCQGCPNEYDKGVEESLDEVRNQIANLEAISAQPGRIPRQYHDSLQQLQGQVVFLQNALNAALDRGKKKAKQQAAKEQVKKPTYQGLNA
jgi:hypothetical protein